MRAVVLALGLSLAVACARTPLGADADGSVDEEAGCLYMGCNGVLFCPLGESCPVGDSLPNDAGGGNHCACIDASGAYHVDGSVLGYTCTGNAATCP